MKNLIIAVNMVFFSYAAAQPRKMAVMKPILAKGYYVNQRNDTVNGKVQVNPPNQTDFYYQFSFKKQNMTKPKPFNTRAAVAYGFGNRIFEKIAFEDKMVFAEHIVTGRLDLFEYSLKAKKDGEPSTISYYFIRDNRAEGADSGLRELKEISGKFYRKKLKPYMKDQPTIWQQLDKFNFDRQNLINTIREFNKLYEITQVN